MPFKYSSPAMEITKPSDPWSARVGKDCDIQVILRFWVSLLETGISPGYPLDKK